MAKKAAKKAGIMPQELELWYVLPALRKELAIELKKAGFKQKEIAEKLNITAAAVSQYIRSKRASGIDVKRGLCSELKREAKNIADGKSYIECLQRLCIALRKKGRLCEIHRKIDSVPKDCCICISGH